MEVLDVAMTAVSARIASIPALAPWSNREGDFPYARVIRCVQPGGVAWGD